MLLHSNSCPSHPPSKGISLVLNTGLAPYPAQTNPLKQLLLQLPCPGTLHSQKKNLCDENVPRKCCSDCSERSDYNNWCARSQLLQFFGSGINFAIRAVRAIPSQNFRSVFSVFLGPQSPNPIFAIIGFRTSIFAIRAIRAPFFNPSNPSQ